MQTKTGSKKHEPVPLLRQTHRAEHGDLTKYNYASAATLFLCFFREF